MKSNRFRAENPKPVWGTALPVITFVLVFGFFFYAIIMLSERSAEQQIKSLETAVTRDVLHCFASEGEYPESMSYIEENYALSYDHNKFEIEYAPGGDGNLPYVKVSLKQ